MIMLLERNTFHDWAYEVKKQNKLTNKGIFCRTISSSTGKHFPNRSVTPPWEFVVAPAGYSFTANTTPLSPVKATIYIKLELEYKETKKKLIHQILKQHLSKWQNTINEAPRKLVLLLMHSLVLTSMKVPCTII